MADIDGLARRCAELGEENAHLRREVMVLRAQRDAQRQTPERLAKIRLLATRAHEGGVASVRFHPLLVLELLDHIDAITGGSSAWPTTSTS